VLSLHVVGRLDRRAIPVTHDVHRHQRRGDGEQNPTMPPPRQQPNPNDTGLDQAKINSPFESSEYTSGARGTARVSPTRQQSAEEDGEGDEAGEPEEHGEGLDGQDGELVGRSGEEPGREGEVDEG